MQEGNVLKASARENFGLGLTRSVTMPVTTPILPNLANNASQGQ